MLSKLCDVIYDCVAQRNEAQRSSRLVSSVNRVRCAATIIMTDRDACGSHGSASIFYSLLFYSILPLNICTFPLLYCIAVASHKRKCIKSFAQRDEIGRKKKLFFIRCQLRHCISSAVPIRHGIKLSNVSLERRCLFRNVLTH